MSNFNYFKEIVVDGYSFPTNPQANFGFNSQGFLLLNRGSNVIQYSFNGTDLHGDMNPSDSSIGVAYDFRAECKIWFRVVGGTSTVRVEAWRPRN